MSKLKICYISKLSTNKLFHFIWMILSVSSKHFKDVVFALVAELVLKLLLYPEFMPLAVGGISSYEIHNCRKVLIRGIWILGFFIYQILQDDTIEARTLSIAWTESISRFSAVRCDTTLSSSVVPSRSLWIPFFHNITLSTFRLHTKIMNM